MTSKYPNLLHGTNCYLIYHIQYKYILYNKNKEVTHIHFQWHLTTSHLFSDKTMNLHKKRRQAHTEATEGVKSKVSKHYHPHVLVFITDAWE